MKKNGGMHRIGKMGEKGIGKREKLALIPKINYNLKC